MSEWIGGIIAFWPLWAVAIVILLVSVVWCLYYFTTGATDFPWKKKEWWQDRMQRIEKESAQHKAKKG